MPDSRTVTATGGAADIHYGLSWEWKSHPFQVFFVEFSNQGWNAVSHTESAKAYPLNHQGVPSFRRILDNPSQQRNPQLRRRRRETRSLAEGPFGRKPGIGLVPKAPKDAGAGIEVNPSGGPASPPHPHAPSLPRCGPSAFRLAGKPPPDTRPYEAPLSAGGGLCNTLQSGRFERVSLATLSSGKLSANSSSHRSLSPPTPHPLRSGLSSPPAPRTSSPAAAPRPSPGRCGPAGATPSWRQRAGHADSRRRFCPRTTKLQQMRNFSFTMWRMKPARESGVVAP
ncbi:translation initiation factor IF-2-like [Cervus elaphus]|uniref:translation initiation factor IF-2-like n=1 Tax=Cervus elaphus TaxID=9860 RepID=UPI001CC2AE58|nr:translation initiation factor IF-2-like [Cervus elaphus]